MALQSSQLLGNRYRVIKALGQGGMGTVYLAWHTQLDMEVAIKEMTPQPGLDSNVLSALREQFRREAMTLARLDHSNLVRVMDFFEEHGNVYLVMAFVEGRSLADIIAQQGALPEAQVLEWAEQLLSAVAYCHNRGILHRDIKPQNVIVRADNQAVLVDFGLVKLWDPNDPQTRTTLRGMGTPEYAPPEQYEAIMGHTDPRSDVYSLGATLYHALIGQAPPTATLRMAYPERFTEPWAMIAGVSEQVKSAIVKSMELASSQRWASAAEMGAGLGLPAFGGALPKPPRAAATVAVTRTRRMADPTAIQAQPVGQKRIPAWLWALGALLILLIIVGIVVVASGMLGSSSATPEPPPLPELSATHTPRPTSTPTPRPIATETPLPTATAVYVPLPVLLSPENDAAYYTTSWVSVAWEWELSLPENQRFVVVIEDETGHKVLFQVMEAETSEYNFVPKNVGLEAGSYTWYVQVEQQAGDDWDVVAQSEPWTIRFVPPQAPTPYGSSIALPPALAGETPVQTTAASTRLFSLVLSALLLMGLFVLELVPVGQRRRARAVRRAWNVRVYLDHHSRESGNPPA